MSDQKENNIPVVAWSAKFGLLMWRDDHWITYGGGPFAIRWGTLPFDAVRLVSMDAKAEEVGDLWYTTVQSLKSALIQLAALFEQHLTAAGDEDAVAVHRIIDRLDPFKTTER